MARTPTKQKIKHFYIKTNGELSKTPKYFDNYEDLLYQWRHHGKGGEYYIGKTLISVNELEKEIELINHERSEQAKAEFNKKFSELAAKVNSLPGDAQTMFWQLYKHLTVESYIEYCIGEDKIVTTLFFHGLPLTEITTPWKRLK